MQPYPGAYPGAPAPYGAPPPAGAAYPGAKPPAGAAPSPYGAFIRHLEETLSVCALRTSDTGSEACIDICVFSLVALCASQHCLCGPPYLHVCLFRKCGWL